MYSEQAAQALSKLSGVLPDLAVQEMVGLFADCEMPLGHDGQVTLRSASDQQIEEPIYIDQIINNQYDESPSYYSLAVYNPISVLNVDVDNPYIDGGFAFWVWGVSWLQWMVSYYAWTQTIRTTNLYVENIYDIDDLYRYEDVSVVDDVIFNWDPDTCTGTVYVKRKTIKVLVKRDDGAGNSGGPQDSNDDNYPPSYPGGSQNYPSGSPGAAEGVVPQVPPQVDTAELQPMGNIDPAYKTSASPDVYKFSVSPDYVDRLNFTVRDEEREQE